MNEVRCVNRGKATKSPKRQDIGGRQQPQIAPTRQSVLTPGPLCLKTCRDILFWDRLSHKHLYFHPLLGSSSPEAKPFTLPFTGSEGSSTVQGRKR